MSNYKINNIETVKCDCTDELTVCADVYYDGGKYSVELQKNEHADFVLNANEMPNNVDALERALIAEAGHEVADTVLSGIRERLIDEYKEEE